MKNIFLIGFFFVFSLYGSTAKFTIFSLNSPTSETRERALKKTLLKEQQTAAKHVTIANMEENAFEGYDSAKINKLNDMHIDVAIIDPDKLPLINKEKDKILNHAKFHLLAANFLDDKGSYLLGPLQALVYEVDDVNVGVFAISSSHKSSKKDKKIYYLPSSFAAKKMIEELKRKKVDVIIAISHQSLEEDKELLKSLKDIDMIVGCHKKETISSYHDQTFIYKLSHLDAHIARIDLAIEKKNPPQNDEISIYPSWRDVKIEE